MNEEKPSALEKPAIWGSKEENECGNKNIAFVIPKLPERDYWMQYIFLKFLPKQAKKKNETQNKQKFNASVHSEDSCINMRSQISQRSL